MNSWTKIIEDCKKLFKFTPQPFQLRLWWYGNKGVINDQHAKHRAQVERKVNLWDVVVRLALQYTKKVVIKSGHKWNDAQICAFIYYLLWMPYRQFVKKEIDGKEVNLPTWWNWAVEHRNDFDSEAKGKLIFQNVLERALAQLKRG